MLQMFNQPRESIAEVVKSPQVILFGQRDAKIVESIVKFTDSI